MADISSIKLPDNSSYDIKDPSKVAKAGDTMTGTLGLRGDQYFTNNGASGLNANNSDIIGLNSLYFNDASETGKEGINFRRDNGHWDSLYVRNGELYLSPYRQTDSDGTNEERAFYSRPWCERGTTDVAMRSMVDFARANRLAFLPPSQVIIEKTTDGGITWESANYSDDQKKLLFGTRGASIQIPLLNGAKSLNCGIRVTFTAMKYNVPSETTETNKYSYWNNEYVSAQERYSNLRELWFWISANNDTIQPKVYAAKGNDPNNWVTYFDKDFRMTGWSGSDWVRWNSAPAFGGGTSQPQNYWNWRIEFWSRYADNKTDFQSTTAQVINGIFGFGDSVWGTPNGMMKDGHLYTYDANQNATFPAKVTATSFSGSLTGNVTGNATTATNAPTQASINSTGLVTFKNGAGTNLFTLQLPESSGGTVTQVTAGTGLKIDTASSGGTITTSGTINHINSVTAQTTQALYPIKIDAQGHISEYGTAVTSLPASDVSAWAKAATKPTYTASEVGALPDTTTIPSKTSDLTNDSGFITGMTILSYGNSTWNDFINAYDANKVVYCRASSNANPASGSQTRLAFMAYVNNATTPTEVEFQYYRSVSTHTESQQGDQVYVYKLNKNSGWSVTVRETSIKVAYNNGITGTYSNGVMTLKHANTAITAQLTQAVYPIAIDAYGHITGYGSAVTIPEIPSVTVSDNGKILTVVNGAWAAAELPIYQGGVS